MLNENDKILEQPESVMIELEDDVEIVCNTDIEVEDDEKFL